MAITQPKHTVQSVPDAGLPAVDTNVLVCLLGSEDNKQVAAESFISAGAWVSHLVLAETVWVLDAVLKHTAEQVAAAVRVLLSHDNLTIQDDKSVHAALEHFQRWPHMNFADCLKLATAHRQLVEARPST